MPRLNEKHLFWGTLLIFTLLLFYRLGSWGVLETSEARYAEMSWEMYETGDLLHPSFLQLRHYHKPPLTYAITAGAYGLFGATPFATRFFLQLALLLQLCLVYQIGKLLFKDKGRARVATLIYLSFPVLLIAARSLTTDLYLVTFLLLGVWCWLRAERHGNPLLWTVAAYAAWGLAALTKGAGVVILPAVLLPTYYLLFRPASWWRLLGRHALGAIVFAVIGLSWYAMLIYQDRSLLDYFLIEQTVKRYTTDQWYRAQPWWFYIATVSATALPWCWLALAQGRNLVRTASKKREVWLMIAWVVGPIVFYSLAQSKLILYVLPAYAGLAFLSVLVLEKLTSLLLLRTSQIMTALFSIIFLGLLLAPLVSPEVNGGSLYIFWAVAAIATLIGGAWWLRKRSGLPPTYQLLMPVVAFNILLLPMSAEFFRNNELLVNSPQPVVDFLKAEGLADRNVYTLHRKIPSIAFALGKPTVMLYVEKLGRDTTHQAENDWHPYWLDTYNPTLRDSLQAMWLKNPAVVIGYRTPDSLSLDLLKKFSEQQSIGKFTVYY